MILILLTPVSLSLLLSLLLNIVLGGVVAKLALRNRTSPTVKPGPDPEAFQNRLSSHNYATVQYNRGANETRDLSPSRTANEPPEEVLDLEPNPLYIPVDAPGPGPSDPPNSPEPVLSPLASPSYCEVN